MDLFHHINIMPSSGRGGFGAIVGWFIRVVIYDICITGISDVLGVSRMVALLIFLGGLLGVSLIGYIMRKKMSPQADEI